MKIFLCLAITFAASESLGFKTSPQKRSWHHHGLGSPSIPPGVEVPPDQWFVQLLDHFKPTDDRTWKQRFRMTDKFYKPGGPAFLMIGGEGPANAAWMVAGTWLKYAEEFGAICFQLEHRFYGESHPTDDMSVKNLIYLTSEQALADIANFVTSMNKKFNLTEARWISFGGSYPGSLSAWLRLKYPHLIHGAVSTSGPLVASADFPEYLQVVSSALERTNSRCLPAVQDGLARAAKLLEHPMGWKLLGTLFKLCTPLNATNTNDVANLFESLIGMFEDVVQYNKDNREFEGIVSNVTIDTLCNYMTSDLVNFPEEIKVKMTPSKGACVVTEEASGKEKPCILPFEHNGLHTACTNKSDADGKYWCSTKVDRFGVHVPKVKAWGYCDMDNPACKGEVGIKGITAQAGINGSPLASLAVINDYNLKVTNQTCLSFSYDDMIKDFMAKNWNSSAGAGGRQWMYQTCTEFGWYQSSNQPGNPFTNFFPLSFFEQQCIDIFGPKFNVASLQASVDRTNRMYGGKDIHVNNVVFVHGSFDPWHALGVTKDLSPDATAILIPETSHCANMYPEREDDPPQLKQARVTVGKKLRQWLKKSNKRSRLSKINRESKHDHIDNINSNDEEHDEASHFPFSLSRLGQFFARIRIQG